MKDWFALRCLVPKCGDSWLTNGFTHIAKYMNKFTLAHVSNNSVSKCCVSSFMFIFCVCLNDLNSQLPWSPAFTVHCCMLSIGASVNRASTASMFSNA